jgi:hypothetical protein
LFKLEVIGDEWSEHALKTVIFKSFCARFSMFLFHSILCIEYATDGTVVCTGSLFIPANTLKLVISLIYETGPDHIHTYHETWPELADYFLAAFDWLGSGTNNISVPASLRASL